MMDAMVSEARHLPKTVTAVQRRAIVRALRDVGVVVETPPGSNRGAIIDEYNTRGKAPLGSFWCASAAGAWWLDAGLTMPPGYPSCDAIMAWARKTNRWSSKPDYGALVLYGKPGDANHIGLIVAIDPLILSVEGNTTVEGGTAGESRNGIAVSLKIVTDKDPVLGYCLPFAATPAGAKP